MRQIQVIESHQLSNGDTVRITKLGRSYSFNRLFHSDDEPPYCEIGIPLKQAMSLLAGALQQDVMELD